mgnify:CR=1 FL=1
MKRVYGNFDKEIAYRMFGYRVKFDKEELLEDDRSSWPSASQNHKPLAKFAGDVCAKLAEGYVAFPY